MFCPKCDAYLTEKEIVKGNVKYAPGNVPIEYDARCPNCRVEMGRVSWGQLTPNPEIAKNKTTEAAETPAVPGSGKSARKTCPHCGKILPEDF